MLSHLSFHKVITRFDRNAKNLRVIGKRILNVEGYRDRLKTVTTPFAEPYNAEVYNP